MPHFTLNTPFSPAGDQPKAIEALINGLARGDRHQTLLGVTGSGKTFTGANVIARYDKPTLVIAHNKTLAAQLAQEYRQFFPTHAVHYFVSYYDYYQPEAYIPVTDTFIEKDASINAEIDRLRHASTQALLSRRDVIIVASVSCIYGLGSPVEYEKVNLKLKTGDRVSRAELLRRLVAMHFERTGADLQPGTFRAIGNSVEIMPISEQLLYRFELVDNTIDTILQIDPVSSTIKKEVDTLFLFPAKHFVTGDDDKARALLSIRAELETRLKELNDQGKLLEAERLKRRTTYDLAMIEEIGYCSGIENYSRHFSGRAPGEAPDTLLSYFPHLPDGTPDFLTIIDESHVTLPQLAGMYAGDAARKKNLVEHGFRLPSAVDNRPLQFDEFNARIGPVIYTSATPSTYEREKSTQIVEQVIRPTGLVDPVIEIRPILPQNNYPGQVEDLILEITQAVQGGSRVLATTLTKKMAEDLSDYLKRKNVKATYLHSDVKTIDRIRVLTDFRKGVFDCLVGVNLLREGLDLPEVTLVGILDADKEGFLRSETSLIQTIGRAARNAMGRVILYADQMTGSLDRAIGETQRRREIQLAYNQKHGITPETIHKAIHDITEDLESSTKRALDDLIRLDRSIYGDKIDELIREKEQQMMDAAQALDFETAALLRDELQALRGETGKKKKPVKKRGR